MAIRQISALIPNQEGALADLTEILYRNGIDLRAITVFDTSEYGILRCIVDDPDRAVVLLNSEGVVAKVTEVLAMNPKDEIGSLHRIFRLLGDNMINIDYIYAYYEKKDETQYFVIKVNNLKKAEELLKANGVRVK